MGSSRALERVHGKPTPPEVFRGGTHPILSKTCFPFLLSALLPPVLLPAHSSHSAPVILSSLPSCPLSLHVKTQRFAPAPGSTFLRGLSPAQSGRAKCWVRALVFFSLRLFYFHQQGRVHNRDCLCPLHPVRLRVPHGHPGQKAAPVPQQPEVPLPSRLSPESSLVYCHGRDKSKFGQSTVRQDFVCGFDWHCHEGGWMLEPLSLVLGSQPSLPPQCGTQSWAGALG